MMYVDNMNLSRIVIDAVVNTLPSNVERLKILTLETSQHQDAAALQCFENEGGAIDSHPSKPDQNLSIIYNSYSKATWQKNGKVFTTYGHRWHKEQT